MLSFNTYLSSQICDTGELWSTANNLFCCCHLLKKEHPKLKKQASFQFRTIGFVQKFSHCATPGSHSLYPILLTLTKSQAIQTVEDATGLSWKVFSPRSQWKHSELKEAKRSPPYIHQLWTEASSPCCGTTGDRHIMSPHCQTAWCCWPPVTPIYKCGLKTCLPSQHSSRSVLNKLTADKPERGSASWLVWSDEG